MEKRWIVRPEEAGLRLDVHLAQNGAGPSRAYIQKLIAGDSVSINGKTSRASQRLAVGDEILLSDPGPSALDSVAPEEIPLSVVYEDRDLLVIDKPRGMVVHPAPGNYRGTLVNALLAHCGDLSGIGGKIRPGIVHRLDKDTTGLLVVAKNDLAHLGLAAQIKARAMTRIYLALIHGAMPAAAGKLEMPIARHPRDRKRMAVVAGGRPAVTFYRVLETLGNYSLLQIKLATGRTHQIRVHFSAIGHPVVEDRTYGRHCGDFVLSGQALHAAELILSHPRTGETMHFQAPPPSDFQEALTQARLIAGAL
jgi:23S rRNA pseudouridine1911/1915/1917 synthase